MRAFPFENGGSLQTQIANSAAGALRPETMKSHKLRNQTLSILSNVYVNLHAGCYLASNNMAKSQEEPDGTRKNT